MRTLEGQTLIFFFFWSVHPKKKKIKVFPSSVLIYILFQQAFTEYFQPVLVADGKKRKSKRKKSQIAKY